ncbi:MAG: DUF4407 domain-containing protein [Mucilaginibacter sp.]|jgi:hypothetical protein|uniref:DUF4407 domain-containing protein n=1 Tax=Mucilaginibacter sp. TaxID=1882438 RepID=UPI0035679E93
MTEQSNYFWRFSGEDIGIIRICAHRGIRDRFALVGAITLVVFIISFFSCWYTFQMLFDSPWLAVPVALFFAWMINNIYLLLLTTLAKPVLQFKNKGVIKHLSLSLRAGFVILFAVFISKPLEAWFFEPLLSEKIELIKQESIRKAEQKVVKAASREEKALSAKIRKKEALHYPEADIAPLRAELDELRAEQTEAFERIEFVIGRADYFVQRLELVTGNRSFIAAWLFTLLIIFIFLLPIYLKRTLNLANPYFKHKSEIYNSIVINAYRDFKLDFERIFFEKYGIQTKVHETYADAPYNTKKIADRRTFNGQEDFLKLYR